jgi:ATP-dependent Clp protease ATP-binding subunit ClpC
MAGFSQASILIWHLADAEAKTAGFDEISPWHLLVACFKACDLELADFLDNAPVDIRNSKAEIEKDFGQLSVLVRAKFGDPTSVRRLLRHAIGKGTKAAIEAPLHRTPEARQVFAQAESRANSRNDIARPLDLFEAIFVWAPNAHLQGELAKFVDDLYVKMPASHMESPIEHKAIEGIAPEQKEGPESILALFGRDITKLARENKLEPVIGRKEEMRHVARILSQKRKNNPILVGDPGVGKTGIVEGLAQRIATGQCPDYLRDTRIVDLSLAALVAGTKYRGEFEARLQAVIKEAEATPNLVLFLDEIHTLVGAGAVGGSSMDAGNIFKPALARGSIRVIGATTTDEYRRDIEKDAALERRFQVVWIEEPSREDALEILRGLRERFEGHHSVKIADTALEAAVDLSTRYLQDFRLPDKAIDLIDQACAMAMLRSFSAPKARKRPQVLTIGRDHVAAAVAERCKIPVGQLSNDDRARLLDIERALEERVKGQPRAIHAVANAVRVARSGMKDPRKPIAVFLFAGPTGTGKTELAKALAEFLFGSESSLLRFDMSEYMEEHSVSKLIGAPPGYKGHDEGGKLTDAVRSNPYSVVLLDEIEKAHPRVLDLFLQVFDEGMLTDSRGRKASFREAVIILTSNLGGAAEKIKRLGFREDSSGALNEIEALNARVMEAVKRHVRPELLNRLSRVIIFNPLGRDNIREIIHKFICRLNQRLADQNLRLTIEESVCLLLAERGYSAELGARPLERAIEELIAQPLARAILEGRIESGRRLIARVENGVVLID